jgi:opacity protein-like surface antigen
MANLIYDFDFGLPVSPHIGGGIGAAEVTRNLTNIFGGTHDTVAVFAYQGMAGVRYWLNPAVAIDLDYRYFATTETTFLSTNVGGDRIHSNYRTHNVIASFVYRFGP